MDDRRPVTAPPTLAPPALVICLGNADRGDDGIGPRIAMRLRRERDLPAEVITHRGDAVGLLERWRGYRHVVLVDAVVGDGSPGTVRRFDASFERPPLALGGTSTHGLSAADAIELARALGDLPPVVDIVAVEARTFAPGGLVSDALLHGMDAAVGEIRALLVR